MQPNPRLSRSEALQSGRTSAAAMPTPHQAEKLRRLILAFSTRNMDVLDAAVLLGCSSASASAYLEQLRQANIIASSASGCGAGTTYTLQTDTSIVDAYLESLHGATRERFVFVGRHSSKRGLFVNGRYFHIMKDDLGFVLRISDEPARRDPLVAALFGEAHPRWKEH